MLIGDLVRETGLSKDTIRFYEKQGLIKISRQDRRENNYKEYPASVFDDLHNIKRLKKLGFTLTEIGDFLAFAQHKMASCDLVGDAMITKLKSIDDKIAELTALRNTITSVFTDLKDCCTDIPKGENCGIFDPHLTGLGSFRSLL